MFSENTEGLYTGVGGQFKRDTPDEVAIEAEMNTRKGVERIIRAAFEYADQHARTGSACRTSPTPCVTATTSGSVPSRPSLPNTPPLQPATSVDVLAMELVRCPEQSQVVVTNNLFGDITDLARFFRAALVSPEAATSTRAR